MIIIGQPGYQVTRLSLVAAAMTIVVMGCGGQKVDLVVDRWNVRVDVLPSTIVQIQEAISVRFGRGGTTMFERDISSDRVEAFQFVAAAIDGQAISPGALGPKTLRVDEGHRSLRVTWTSAGDAPGATHVVALTYRAVGGVAIQGARGRLALETIPSRRGYDVAAGEIGLTIPVDALLYDGTGIAEAGWVVRRAPNGIVAERQALPGDEPATLLAQFSINRSGLREPDWQANEAWAHDLVPAWISGGLFILVVGAGILWIVRFQYSKATPEDATELAGVRRALRTSGLVTMALAIVTGVIAWFALDRFGYWPMAVPVSVFMVGLAFAAVHRRWV